MNCMIILKIMCKKTGMNYALLVTWCHVERLGGSGEGKRFLSLPTAVGLRQQHNFISQGPLNLSEMLDLQVTFYQCQDYKQTLNLPRENCLY